MPEKKQESFTVTDRRLFTSEGELRHEVTEEEVSTSKPPTAARIPRSAPSASLRHPPAIDARRPRRPPPPSRRNRPTPTANPPRISMPASN